MTTIAGAGAVSTIGHDATNADGFRFEVTIDSSSDGDFSALIGVANGSWNTANEPSPYPGHSIGGDLNSWACSLNQESYPASSHNAAFGDTTEINRLAIGVHGASLPGRTLGFLLKAGNLYVISCDQVDAGGAHAGQVSAYQLFHGLTGTLFAAIGSTAQTARTMGFTVNFGATPFVGTLPAWLNAASAGPWDVSPPVAAFSADAVRVSIGNAVQFNNESTGVQTSWLWDFGDGTTSTDENPLHIYSGAGRYTASLTVTNAAGSNTLTKPYYITVIGVPASFPCIAWDNLFHSADATVVASSEQAGFEKENAYDWRAWTWFIPEDGEQYLELQFASAVPFNCLAIYGHNLGANAGYVKLQYSVDSGATWLDAMPAVMPAGSEVIYRRCGLVTMANRIRLYINSAVASRFASVFIGMDMELERGCRNGFGPPAKNRTTKITNTVSQNGVFLGRSLIYQGGTVLVNPDFLTEDFLTESWMPFVEHAEKYPWFLLWDESEHFDEGAWCFSDGQIAGSQFTSRQYMNASIKAMTRVK